MDLVITLMVVGLLLALTTLVLNYTCAHVNVIISVGVISSISFLAALILCAHRSVNNSPHP